jgi:DNA-binding NarL/FixJ family response regulator
VTPKIRVAVCGSSLYMAGLAASLQVHPDVEVLRIPANPTALLHGLDELAPAVVAFDLDEMPGDVAISLLRDRPELVLIGVDPSSDRMLLLSGRQEQPVSAAELLQAITGGSVGCSPPNFRNTDKHAQEVSASPNDSDEGDRNDHPRRDPA